MRYFGARHRLYSGCASQSSECLAFCKAIELLTQASAFQGKRVSPYIMSRNPIREFTLRGQKSLLPKAATVNEKAICASFIISHWIAKTGKPCNSGEAFFYPALKRLFLLCVELLIN